MWGGYQFIKNGKLLTTNFQSSRYSLNYLVSTEMKFFHNSIEPEFRKRIGCAKHVIKSKIKKSKSAINYEERHFFKRIKRIGKSISSLGFFGKGVASGEKLLFESTVDAVVKNQLNGVINDLTQIKKANDEILPEMQAALNQVSNEFNSIFPIDMSGDIEEVINANGLKPQQYADTSAIKAVDNEINKHKRIAKNLIEGVHNTIKNQENMDSEWSHKFRL